MLSAVTTPHVQTAVHPPILDCILDCINVCAQKQPLGIVRCGIAASVMGVPLSAANSLRNMVLLDIIHTVASITCASPDSTSSPRRAGAASALITWSDILNSKIVLEISGIDPTDSVESMFDAMLLGSSVFRMRCNTLLAQARHCKDRTSGDLVCASVMFNALSLHFRSHYASNMYRSAVRRFCATLCESVVDCSYPSPDMPQEECRARPSAKSIALQDGWTQEVDVSTGRVFYANPRLGVRTWNAPVSQQLFAAYTPTRPIASDYSSDLLAALVRCMMQLVFRGDFLYNFLGPCASFLRARAVENCRENHP